MTECPHRRPKHHEDLGAERCGVPERRHDRECDGEPEQAGTPVEQETSWVRIAGDQVVDELTRSTLILGRKVVRRLYRDPQDRPAKPSTSSQSTKANPTIKNNCAMCMPMNRLGSSPNSGLAVGCRRPRIT
jgi:hypothetical protein